MKKMNLLLFFYFLKLSFSNLISSKSKTSYFKILRNLWEEDMQTPSGRSPDEETSIRDCSKSNYKYFNFLLSGAPVSFYHSLSDGYTVR